MFAQEHAVWSVYGAAGGKILALLTPACRGVTYAPAGMTVLKLNRERLPTYHEAVAMFSLHSDLFVVTPYRKGRCEAEVTALIWSVRQKREVRDLDVSSFPLYTGKYGDPKPVRALLPEVKNLSLTFVYPSSPLYSTLLELEDVGLVEHRVYPLPSGIILGPPLETITDGAYLVSLGPDSTSGLKDGHAFVLEVRDEVAEVTDSNGPDAITTLAYEWFALLQQRKLLSHEEVYLPQEMSFIDNSFNKEGLCIIWSYWYLRLRELNPEREGWELRRYLQLMDPRLALDKLRRIASSIYI